MWAGFGAKVHCGLSGVFRSARPIHTWWKTLTRIISGWFIRGKNHTCTIMSLFFVAYLDEKNTKFFVHSCLKKHCKRRSFCLIVKKKKHCSQVTFYLPLLEVKTSKSDTFQGCWAKHGSKISQKSTHLFSINEIQTLLCANRHRCECWGSFEVKPTSFSQRGL